MTPEEIRTSVDLVREELEKLLRAGQPSHWICDQRTRDMWCIGYWLAARYETLEPDRKRELLALFNRITRPTEDLFAVASLVVEVGDSGGDTSDVSKDFWTARRPRW